MNKKNIITFAISVSVFFIFIATTSPYKLPLLFIIFPAIPLLVAVISLTKLALSLLHVRRELWQPIVLFTGLVCGILAVLLSLGQLTFKDFFLLLGLGTVGSFYIARMFRSES